MCVGEQRVRQVGQGPGLRIRRPVRGARTRPCRHLRLSKMDRPVHVPVLETRPASTLSICQSVTSCPIFELERHQAQTRHDALRNRSVLGAITPRPCCVPTRARSALELGPSLSWCVDLGHHCTGLPPGPAGLLRIPVQSPHVALGVAVRSPWALAVGMEAAASTRPCTPASQAGGTAYADPGLKETLLDVMHELNVVGRGLFCLLQLPCFLNAWGQGCWRANSPGQVVQLLFPHTQLP